MIMISNVEDNILDLARRKGVIRPRDLIDAGLSPVSLWRLYKKEKLIKVGRGMYALPDADITENNTLVEAAVRVPHGVICLLSALRFHDLTTQSPFQVWMAIDAKARRPTERIIPLRFVRFSGDALSAGIEINRIQGVDLKVYNAAKTVADCFKYRNKIGMDVAIEALRDCLRYRKATVDELWRYAKVCRVSEVMRPYMEAIL
jgi:predicted transcriptional regulator of viral defense system